MFILIIDSHNKTFNNDDVFILIKTVHKISQLKIKYANNIYNICNLNLLILCIFLVVFFVSTSSLV